MIWSWEVTISERYIVGITKACTKGLAPPRDKKLKNKKNWIFLMYLVDIMYNGLERGRLLLSLWIQSACIHSSGRKCKKSKKGKSKVQHWEMQRKSTTKQTIKVKGKKKKETKRWTKRRKRLKKGLTN